MKYESRLIPLFCFVVMLVFYPAIEQKTRVAIWHLWNGNVMRFQEFDIPVPMSWIALVRGQSIGLVEVGKGHTRELIPPIISVSSGIKDLDLVSSLNERSILSQEAQVFDRRTIEFDGERANCIVSYTLVHKLSPPVKAISITCASTAGLSIFFSGDKEYIETFFSVVSGIQRNREVQN